VTNRSQPREELLTMREVALELATSRHKVLTMCVLAGVRATKVGSGYLLRRSDVEQLRRFLADSVGVPA
jgi:excisionase family DNA binding protein